MLHLVDLLTPFSLKTFSASGFPARVAGAAGQLSAVLVLVGRGPLHSAARIPLLERLRSGGSAIGWKYRMSKLRKTHPSLV